MDKVKAFGPATVANLGVGFDVLGMAVDSIGDYVTVERSPGPGVEIVEITGDDGLLPRDPEKNTAAVAAQRVLAAIGTQEGVKLHLEKGLPLASGLGSSAASAVAAAVATNALFDEALTTDELLGPVLDAEEAVSGRHADNVAPGLFGGIVLLTGLTPAEIHHLPIPDGIFLTLSTPAVGVPTAEARAVLPEVVPLDVVVHQTAVIAELIHALHKGDIHLLGRAMQRDTIIEPAREHFIPHLAEVRQIAKASGALATIISGAGPSICSFCAGILDAEHVGDAVRELYSAKGLEITVRVAAPSSEGAHTVE